MNKHEVKMFCFSAARDHYENHNWSQYRGNRSWGVHPQCVAINTATIPSVQGTLWIRTEGGKLIKAR